MINNLPPRWRSRPESGADTRFELLFLGLTGSLQVNALIVPLPHISSLKRSEFAKCLSTNRADLKNFEKICHFEL